MIILRSPDEQESTGGGDDTSSFASNVQEQMSSGLEEAAKSDAEAVSRETTDNKPEEKPVEEKPVEDDPEYEMDWEEEQGKKAKYKLSQMKKDLKWYNENRGMIAGANKLREIASKNEGFAKLVQKIVENSYDGQNYNTEFINKTLESFETKKDAIKEEIGDKTDEIKDVEGSLSDLDPDSPQAIALHKSLNIMKSQREQLKKALETIKQFESKITNVEKNQNDFITKQNEEIQSVEVKRLSSVFEKEFGALTDATKQNGMRFIDEDEKKEFEAGVRNLVAGQSQNIKNDQDFIKAIQQSAKAVYDKYSKRREANVNEYLRQKGLVKPVVPVKEKTKEPMDSQGWGDALADAVLSDKK